MNQTSHEAEPSRETARLTGDALTEWLAVASAEQPPTKGSILVVCLRNRLWMEWAVYAACYLYRMGYRPVLLFSSREVRDVYEHEAISVDERQLWNRIRSVPIFDFIDLDRFLPKGAEAALPAGYLKVAATNAHTTLAYNLGVEAFEAEPDSLYSRALPQARRVLARFAVACERALKTLAPGTRAVCPSGVISWSGSFLAAALEAGVPTTYVEFWTVRPGHMIWNRDRPAVELDIAGWREAIGPWTAAMESEIDEFMTFRETPTDTTIPWIRRFRGAQRSPKEEDLPDRVKRFFERPGAHFLLGPNVVGDSAILGRATIFRSQRDWIASTCAFFRAHPHMNLIVRAHPLEVAAKRTKVRLADIARESAGGADNICVLGGEEDVNTYAVASRIRAGIVWTSTLGVDLVARGKPTVVVARAPYLDLGVGTAVTSPAHYHRQLLALADSEQPVGEAMRRASKLYQWIAFRAMSLEATTPELLAGYYHMGPRHDDDQDRFYRVLAGELDSKGRPLRAESSSLASDLVSSPT